MKDTRLLLVGLLAVVLLGIVLFKSVLTKPNGVSQPGVASASASVARTDANGVAWTLDQAGGALVTPGPDGPKAGPPILVKTDVQKVGEREMSIGLLLEGQAGEQYRPVVKKNGTAMSVPPGVRIVSEAGQVIAQGSFQYG
jgi:hypothetical protein